MKNIIFILGISISLISCIPAPSPNYAYRTDICSDRQVLATNLLKLLPENLTAKEKAAARTEADWLALTAYDRSAAIARFNRTLFINWINNAIVNMDWRDRGLCYHYQHDLYRDLRRKKINYFDIHLTVRDHTKGSEHHCVYICAKDKTLMQAILLDPWYGSGRLKIIYPEDRKGEEWTEEPDFDDLVNKLYPEGHQLPENFHIPDQKKHKNKEALKK